MSFTWQPAGFTLPSCQHSRTRRIGALALILFFFLLSVIGFSQSLPISDPLSSTAPGSSIIVDPTTCNGTSTPAWCNGSNSTTDIGAAWNAASVHLGKPGGTIKIATAGGKYSLLTEINPQSTIVNDCNGATINAASTFTGRIFHGVGTSANPLQNLTIQNCVLQNGTNTDPSKIAATQDAIRLEWCNQCLIQNNTIQSVAGRYGIVTVNSNNITVQNNTVMNFGRGGIMNLVNNCSSGEPNATSCTAFNSTTNPAPSTLSHDYLASTNTVDNCLNNNTPGLGVECYGIYISGSEDATIIPEVTNAQALNNTVRNIPRWECLDSHGGSNQIFSGNTCANSYFGLQAGPVSGGYLNNLTVTNNILIENCTPFVINDSLGNVTSTAAYTRYLSYLSTNTLPADPLALPKTDPCSVFDYVADQYRYGDPAQVTPNPNGYCIAIGGAGVSSLATGAYISGNQCAGYGLSSNIADFLSKPQTIWGAIRLAGTAYTYLYKNTCWTYNQACIDLDGWNNHTAIIDNTMVDMVDACYRPSMASSTRYPSGYNCELPVSTTPPATSVSSAAVATTAAAATVFHPSYSDAAVMESTVGNWGTYLDGNSSQPTSSNYAPDYFLNYGYEPSQVSITPYNTYATTTSGANSGTQLAMGYFYPLVIPNQSTERICYQNGTLEYNTSSTPWSGYPLVGTTGTENGSGYYCEDPDSASTTPTTPIATGTANGTNVITGLTGDPNINIRELTPNELDAVINLAPCAGNFWYYCLPVGMNVIVNGINAQIIAVVSIPITNPLPTQITLDTPIPTGSVSIYWQGQTSSSSTLPSQYNYLYWINSPAPGSTLDVGSSVTFTWTTIGTQSYELKLGTTAGSNDIADSGSISGSSYTVNYLPSYTVNYLQTASKSITQGQTIYATLCAVPAASSCMDYTYTAAYVPVDAVLITPAPGSTFTGSTVTFNFTAGNEASAYKLILGTTVGGSDLYNSYTTTATSLTAKSLPTNGATLYARLYSQLNGVWSFNDYTYTAAIPPTMIPAPGSILAGSTVSFSWSGPTIANATDYKLILGTTVGGSDLYNSYTPTAKSVKVTNLPTNGETVYARLYWEINGGWQYADYTYTAQ